MTGNRIEGHLRLVGDGQLLDWGYGYMGVFPGEYSSVSILTVCVISVHMLYCNKRFLLKIKLCV